MSIRYQADNDLNGLIVSATLRFEPAIDFRTARSAGLDGLSDDAVLARAAADNRLLCRLVVIPQYAEFMKVVETLVLIWAGNRPETWVNLITKNLLKITIRRFLRSRFNAEIHVLSNADTEPPPAGCGEP